MINSLKGVKEINGKPICVMDDLREKFYHGKLLARLWIGLS